MISDEDFEREVRKINRSLRVRMLRTPVLCHLVYAYNGVRLRLAQLGR